MILETWHRHSPSAVTTIYNDSTAGHWQAWEFGSGPTPYHIGFSDPGIGGLSVQRSFANREDAIAAAIEANRRAQYELSDESTLDATGSIGIRKWAAGFRLIECGRSGYGDEMLIAWKRSDGLRAIETNGDPVFEHEDGFAAAWEMITRVAI